MHRGRPPRCASRDDRNQVYRFLRERGTSTPLTAVQAAFPQLRRADLKDVLRRYRRTQKQKSEQYKSRLEWRRPGTVWAVDFKERREPIEGRYGSILSVKDLASRCQLAWQPVEEATAEVVQATYIRLFAEHGPPLVLKSDNGGPFRADDTKRLLAEHAVVPLFSPIRCPRYNGGVERANGQLAGYQEALAEFHGRPGMPTSDDAQGALRLANELARPHGWCRPTAGELWNAREPVTAAERSAFLATVATNREDVRAQWEFNRHETLTHYQATAVDRRAVRDALVAYDLLRIRPRRGKRNSRGTGCASKPQVDPGAPLTNAMMTFEKSAPHSSQHDPGAGTITLASVIAPPAVGGAQDPGLQVESRVYHQSEEAHSYTNSSSASGKN